MAWAQLHAAAPPTTAGSLPQKFRTKARAIATDLVGHDQRDDRALIESLIHAVDTLALRCDELANRLARLDDAVGEVVDVLGADLVRLRAAVGGATSRDVDG
ncbi:MAG TPA: hypothetical protein VHB02_07075 [Acidimicrobiales bacterium]|nr:hypothetical protein [Acidimicrobiales bacterium]